MTSLDIEKMFDNTETWSVKSDIKIRNQSTFKRKKNQSTQADNLENINHLYINGIFYASSFGNILVNLHMSSGRWTTKTIKKATYNFDKKYA